MVKRKETSTDRTSEGKTMRSVDMSEEKLLSKIRCKSVVWHLILLNNMSMASHLVCKMFGGGNVTFIK